MYQERQYFIESMNTFIQSSKSSLNNILEELGWTKESIYSTLHKGFQSNENVNNLGETVSSSSDLGTSSNIGLNNASVTLQPLYSDLVESLSQAPSNQRQEDNKSRAEVLAEMLKMERDSKRRRINYKNRVHTKHKSHIEIIREVLAEQMSTLSPLGTGTTSIQSNEAEAKKVESELIEIQFPGGNPHTAWRTILEQVTKDRKSRQENSKDKNQAKLKDRYSNKNIDSDYSSKKRDEHIDKYSERSHKKSDKYKYSEHDYERIRDYDWNYDEKSSILSNDKSQSRNNERNSKSYKKSRHSEEEDIHKKNKPFKNDSYKETDSDDDYRKEKKKKKKDKRGRSSSSSPKRHKSKKHKPKHKRH